MKKANDNNFEKNIEKLVKSTANSEQPPQAFVDSLIDDAMGQLNQPQQTSRPNVFKLYLKPLAMAAAILVVCGLGVTIFIPGIQKSQKRTDGMVAMVDKPAIAEFIPLQIDISAPIVEGTPPNLAGIDNLEEFVKENRPPFMVPAGTTNVALGKPVTSSDEDMTDPLDKIVDGDASGVDDSWVELGLFEQSITIDLQTAQEIYAIVVWHYHKQQRIYNDVVIQTANDQDFTVNVVNHFNNDTDNTHGQGEGKDKKYIEKNEGRLIDTKGTKARFVRLFSTGNNDNELNHYIEVAVYGKPVGK